MTTTQDDGGPAFPVLGKMSSGEPYAQHEGLSLRDWFAGQAIPTVINKCEDYHGGWSADAVAACCYMVADAMLAARKEPSR